MSPLATFIFLLLGLVAFLAATVGVATGRRPINLVALGLSLVTLVAVWNAGVAL